MSVATRKRDREKEEKKAKWERNKLGTDKLNLKKLNQAKHAKMSKKIWENQVKRRK